MNQTAFWRQAILPVAFILLGGCAGGWVQESTPVETDLFGVSGVPGGPVFAVGDQGVFLIREAGRWRKLRFESQARLRAVWAHSEDDVVAVGDDCAAYVYRGAVETPPEGEPPPEVQPVRAATCGDFRDVDGNLENGKAFVVGERTTAQWYQNGGLSNARSFPERLLGVCMLAEDEIFTVGEGGVLYHRSGGNWQQKNLQLCVVKPQDGQCPEEYRIQPVLWDIWVGADGKGAVVGGQGGVWRYPPPQEGEWLAEDTDFDADIYGVAGYLDSRGQTTVFAAGRNGLLLRILPDRIRQDSAGTHDNLNDIWVSPDGTDIYAVGEKGLIIHYH